MVSFSGGYTPFQFWKIYTKLDSHDFGSLPFSKHELVQWISMQFVTESNGLG